MPASRRTLLTTLLSAGVLSAAGCAGRVNRRSHAGGLDLERLERDFAPLAQRARPGLFGLGVMSLDVPAVWSSGPGGRFPMLGLVNAPLAAAALAEVDAGRLTLNEPLRIAAQDLSPPPSRLNRRFPPGGGDGVITVPAADLIALAVQENDSTAADAILRRIGGPGAVTGWLRARNIRDMRVDRYAREAQPAVTGLESFRADWKDDAAWASARASTAPAAREAAMAAFLDDPRDTITVEAALAFLGQLAGGTLLSRPSTALLLRLMTASRTGTARLRAGLPATAALAHQSGESATDLGLTPSTADMGLVTLADGARIAVAAFLTGSTATDAQRDALIADGARTAVIALR